MEKTVATVSYLEKHFEAFKKKTIGFNQYFESPTGLKKIYYADWVASGRLYSTIEEKLVKDFGPFVGNTHTETSVTGTTMTAAYKTARDIIKKHVNASSSDCIILSGSGMTGVINKFQRILGLRVPDQFKKNLQLKEEDIPLVFITHMEHHSNQTSWLETIAQVEYIEPTTEGLVNPKHLEVLLKKYKNRKLKIASVTACSNVTGIETPYYQIAEIMHRNGGLCFVDFACSAPYVAINMHNENPLQSLDAIYFSPHKFLGGPGTPGILIFNSQIYHNQIPDHPGGGTVKWTNPWKEHEYIDNIEDREDGGTPPFLQTIKAALCIRLKEEMGVQNIMEREKEMVSTIFDRLEKIPNLHILAGHIKERLGVISFYIDDLHYNLGVKLLNDKYGIQVRGGCFCAGTYGHYLLHVSQVISKQIMCEIHNGNLSSKPGWIRFSTHPTMSDKDISFICDAIEALAVNHQSWALEYHYDNTTNEFNHLVFKDRQIEKVTEWFNLS
jgi:selenocysteine lyase/cysteine desulfurase